jgi:hypothetical protein
MSNKKIKIILALILSIAIVVFFYRQLLNESFFDADDYNHHAVRTANYYLALKQGQWPVRWGPNLNEGYGYPSFNYTYHFPYLVSVLFYTLGFSIQQSVNLSMLSAVLSSALNAFFLLLFLTKSKKFAFLGSLIYVLNPLFLLNVFWRGAIGEMFFLAFVPLFFLAIEIIFDHRIPRQKYLASFLLLLSLSLMIVSHVPSILLLVFLALPYLIYKIICFLKNNKIEARKNLLLIIASCFWACLLTAWYYLPAFLEKKYIVYDNGQSLTQYYRHFLKLSSLLDFSRTIQSSDQFLKVIQLGSAIVLIFVLALLSLFFNKKNKSIKLILFIILFLLSIFLIHPASQALWQNMQLLQMIQYPWRILWMSVFVALYLLTILLKKINQKFHLTLFLILFMFTIYCAFIYSTRRLMAIKSDYEWFEIASTGTSFDEHRPIWSKMPYVFPADILFLPVQQEELLAAIEDEDQEQLSNFVSSFTDYQLEIKEINGTRIAYQFNSSENVVAIHKRLYFPGWMAQIDGETATILKDLPHYQGVVAVAIPAGEREVLVEFAEKTRLRAVAENLSFVALLISIGGGIYLFFVKKH